MTAVSTPGLVSIDDLPDAVLGLDADRRIVAANQAFARLTGRVAESVIGLGIDELLDRQDRRGSRLLCDEWPSGARIPTTLGFADQPVTVLGADGQPVHTAASGQYRRDGRRLSGAWVTFRPATETASGIEIVSTVSHELRSPLTSVKGYTSLLLHRWDKVTDDQKRMMLEQVNHDADRVTRLITELLDISRLETGRLALHRRMVELPGLAESVVQKVALEYPQLDAVVTFPEPMPAVYADPDKLEQVLTNLVENACKYASPRDLRVAGEADDDSVSVTVTDHGEGIPASDLPKVFSKFFRREVGKPTGSGLGLWISRGLVEAHGGQLVAESKVGQGSSFRFTLPLTDLENLGSP